MNLSIIIVSWNTRDLLVQCLTSIFLYPPTDEYKVWVVDNASQDGSVESITRNFPQVKLIENDTNFGFAKANNQAIQQSEGDYLLLLNPDTEVKPGALDKLIRFMEKNVQAGAVGPRLLNTDKSLQVSCYKAPTLIREFWRLFHLDIFWNYSSYLMHRWNHTAAREVEVIQGACLLVRRQALDQVGAFDEDYFMYSEEVDLCLRLRQKGLRLYWLPQAEVVHYGGQSTEQVRAEMFAQLYRSKILYFRKNHSLLKCRLYKIILYLASIFRIIVSPLALFIHRSSREQHWVTIRNYRTLITEISKM